MMETSVEALNPFAIVSWIGSMMSCWPAVEMIPTKMIMEIPFPTPCSVMRSPSHMVSIAPAV